VQQGRLQQPRVAAQVHGDFRLQRCRLEPRAPLQAREVGSERHLRHAVVDPANTVANDEARLDDAERRCVAVAERRQRRVAHLGEPRHHMTAQARQRDRKARRLDHGRGAGLLAFRTQQRRHSGEPRCC
jgi:hypothetical protein